MIGKLFTSINRKIFRFVLLLFCLVQIVFLIQIHAQTLSVQGKITYMPSSPRYAVKQASIIFIDNADTTNKFSTLTDALGNYQINLILTSVKSGNSLPEKFELEQNYPNPFSTKTTIPYDLNKQSDVQVTIYDILGRVIRKFNVGWQSVGTHNILWDGRNNFGQTVATGVYFYRLYANGESQVKKMIFNQNSNGSFVLPHSYSLNENSFLRKTDKIQNVLGNTFTIRLENTQTTSPVIVPKELENVVIQNDTTINVLVDYIPTVSIDFDSLHQTIRGFGGAEIIGWNPGLNYGDMTRAEIQTAFGNGYGQLGLTILRLRISPDSTQFSANIPSAKLADSLGAIVIASPWTPPAWMKDNNNLVAGRLKTSAYAAYAMHLKAFADTMSNGGVPLYALSVQNEPDANVDYESCYWNATELLNFCKYNAPSIGTRIMMPESQNFVRALSDPTLNDSAAAANVSIIAGHIYGSGLGQYPLAEERGKEIWMTEHHTDSQNSGNLWPLALDIGPEIYNVMISDWNAYVYWWIVRYYGLISDGTTAGDIRGTVTKRGYVMSQYSRFVRPGYYRVECTVFPSSGLYITAYKDSSNSKAVIVAVNINSTSENVAFTLHNTTMNTFIPYTTSEFKSVQQGEVININGSKFAFTLEASSITTFVSN